MIELTTVESFDIKGRGRAHTVKVPAGQRPQEWPGMNVLLDGEPVCVTGVELPVIKGLTAILVRRLPTPTH